MSTSEAEKIIKKIKKQYPKIDDVIYDLEEENKRKKAIDGLKIKIQNINMRNQQQKKAQSLMKFTGLDNTVSVMNNAQNTAKKRKYLNDNPSNYDSYNDYLFKPLSIDTKGNPIKRDTVSKKEFEIYEPLKNKNIRNNLMPTTLKNGTLLDRTNSIIQKPVFANIEKENERKRKYEDHKKEYGYNALSYEDFKKKLKFDEEREQKNQIIKKNYEPISNNILKNFPNTSQTIEKPIENTVSKLNSVYAFDEKERLNKGITMLLKKPILTSGEKSMAQQLINEVDNLERQETTKNKTYYNFSLNEQQNKILKNDYYDRVNEKSIEKAVDNGYSKDLLDLIYRRNILSDRINSTKAFDEGVNNSLSFGTYDKNKDKYTKEDTEKLNNIFKSYDSLKSSPMIENRSETVKSEHPIAKTAGEFTGEGIKYAVGSKALESVPFIQNAGKALQGTKMGQNIFRATKGIVNAEKYSNILADQMLETFINSPRIIAEGIQNGKSAGDITKEVLKSQAGNLLLSGAFETLGAGWKYLKGKGLSDDEISVALKNINDEKVKKANERAQKRPEKQKNKSPRDYVMEKAGVREQGLREYSDIEKMKITKQGKKYNNYVDGKDDTLRNFFHKWKNNNSDKIEKLYLGKTTPYVDEKISDILGYEFSNRDYIATNDDIKHIFREHGDNIYESKRGQIAINEDNIDNLKETLKNPDNIIAGDFEHGKQGIIFEKVVDGNNVVVIEFDNSGRNTLQLRTMYMQKMKNSTPVVNAANAALTVTPKTGGSRSPSINSITENAENINNSLNLSKIYNTDIKNINSVEELQNLRNQLTDNINDYAKIDIQYFANKVDEIDKRMQELVSKYGSFTPGENPYRNIEIPKATEYGKTQRFVRTMAESQNIDDEMLKELKQGIVQGDFSYKAISNEKLINEANAIYSRNPQTAKEIFFGISESGIPAKSSDIALGQKILAEAVQTGDIQTAKRAAAEVSAMLTEAGRTVQASKIFKKLTPEGKMMTAQRVADKLSQKIGKELTIPDDLANALINSKTAQESERALNAIYKNIGSQIPSTFKDKFMQWRYMAMLLNPTTHIRNIAGNIAFIPLRKTSDALSWVGEKIAIKSGLMDDTQATKALLGFSKNDRELKKYGKQVFKENADLIKSGGKYGINNEIEAGRRIFKSNLLEGTRNLAFDSLDWEDNWFMQSAFKDNFAQMMKARGYTKEFLESGTTEANKAFNEVFEYSMDKALKATYRETSEFATFLNRIEDKNWGTRILGGGAFPFKKTPINMLKRGVEYSPIGLIDGVTRGISQLKKNIITPDQFIDKISQGLTGTALIGLGAWLAHEKVLNGSTEFRNKADKYEASIKGIQPFSINVGDGTYTISWLVPTALPMFVGAEIYEALSNSEKPSGKNTLSGILTGISKITEPYTELSCLQGVNDLLKGDNITDVISTTASNYINQFIPTIISKTANTIDDTRRSTYAPTDAPLTKQGQQTINKTINKIPFARNTLQPYVDQWGNEEVENNIAKRIFNNFISPGYYKKNKSDVVDREVQSLYESTGDDAVLPKMVSNYRQVNGKTLYLTPEELTKFQKTYGQTAHSKIQSLIYNPKYLIMSTSNKVEAIKDIYEEADKKAKAEFLNGRGIKESDKK